MILRHIHAMELCLGEGPKCTTVSVTAANSAVNNVCYVE
jgi:hypothetical protein